MLEFTKIDGAYIAEGNNGMTYTIKLIDSDFNLYDIYKKCRITHGKQCYYFDKLAEAKAWAEVDAIETESEDLDFLDSLEGLMP